MSEGVRERELNECKSSSSVGLQIAKSLYGTGPRGQGTRADARRTLDEHAVLGRPSKANGGILPMRVSGYLVWTSRRNCRMSGWPFSLDVWTAADFDLGWVGHQCQWKIVILFSRFLNLPAGGGVTAGNIQGRVFFAE